MNEIKDSASVEGNSAARTASQTSLKGFPRRFAGLGLYLAILIGVFFKPLVDLTRYALSEDLYSHVLIIPFVSFYLIWLKKEARSQGVRSSVMPAAVAVVGGFLVLLSLWAMVQRGWRPDRNAYLFFNVLSFLAFVIGGGFLFLGTDVLRCLFFPIAFLFFTLPLPGPVVEWITSFLQHASADAASALFSVSGAPVFRDGLIFHLPDIVIEVAEECSGIRSSLVLFIVSLLAGYLFLRSPWKRAALALVVIPLGILRNGFRIFTIAMLCVHVGPEMIDSPLHRRGGPVFFILSLVPFFLLLAWLRRLERNPSKIECTVPLTP